MQTTDLQVEEEVGFNPKELIERQREFFDSGQTRPLSFSIEQLKKLKNAILKHEKNLERALKADLNKSEMEAHATEIGITVAEIEHNLRHIKDWVKPQKVSTPLFFLPGKSRIHYEPFGVALIIAPWNYPIKNLFGPALGAVTAGNCTILKPSELSPHTSAAINEMISEAFDPAFMTVVEGGVPETTELLKERFDYIFFTGGTEIGRIVYQAAAKHLTPVTLELGGKSPTIVDKNINLDVTAKRIAWGKFTNAGQTCVAPDYVLVHKKVKEKLLKRLTEIIHEFYGSDPSKSPDFGRIITDRHFNRIKNLIEGDIVTGGDTDENQRYIAPTIIDNVALDAKVMQEEIFGPIMPIIEYEKLDDAISIINSGAKPLALYIFSNSSKVRKRILNETSSGGVCINETIMHLANPNLPFGGIGNSGMGAYNGRSGFDTFSHKRSVLTRSFMFDIKQKYAPFTPQKLNFVKFAIRKLL